ncbi:ATP-dependent DNA helicase [Trichonephila clavipes]|uniref:ATP-dependent DNA helicase n=1 Tax=Trichonephila clavipes TaxID=2585209 RepID=A0A8X6S4M1_TRICX|nr:ATP-dependent DNA helicase [Trichonephila clavipes]
MDFKAAIDSVSKDQKEFKVVINAERNPFGEHKGRFTAPQKKKWPLSSLDKSLKNETLFSVVEADAITATDGQLSELGKMVVLSSSFSGGSRYMHERTQDAMTYVRHFGRPDLFITFTCNSKWP